MQKQNNQLPFDYGQPYEFPSLFIDRLITFGISGPEGQGLFLKAAVAAVFAAIPT
jgi:hypothetical protein